MKKIAVVIVLLLSIAALTVFVAGAFFFRTRFFKGTMINRFDCSFMTGKTSPLYRFGLCLNKMYDSMMAGIPIVCAFDAPDTLVRIYDCGIQCDPNNISEVAEAIRTIRNMPAEEKERLGQNARSAVLEHFTYRHLAEDFVRLAFKQKDM